MNNLTSPQTSSSIQSKNQLRQQHLKPTIHQKRTINHTNATNTPTNNHYQNHKPLPPPLISQEDLFSILKAYSVHRPEVGYCQAQAPLAALLLTIMPLEQAFWCFTTTCDSYLTGYYAQGLVGWVV